MNINERTAIAYARLWRAYAIEARREGKPEESRRYYRHAHCYLKAARRFK